MQAASVIRQLFQNSAQTHIRKHTVLLRADDEIGGLFYLVRGVVRSTILNSSGNSMVLNLYSPGSVFPLSQILAGFRRTPYQFSAVTPCDIRKTDSSALVSAIRNSPDILMDIAQKFAGGLESLAQRFELAYDAPAIQKVAVALALLMHKFGTPQTDGTIRITLAHTHQDLADIAGVSRETATKMLLRIEREGIILNERRSTSVLNPRKLRERAGMETDRQHRGIL